jgi:hypothetical protein
MERTGKISDLLGPTGAIFSEDRNYRYLLWRKALISKSSSLLILGLNPSKADDTRDDPTIRRCTGFARQLGFGDLYVANLFAYCATHPKGVFSAKDPVGGDTDSWISSVASQVDTVLIAWGNHGLWRRRDVEVLKLVKNPVTFGLTKRGAPLHPLYLKKEIGVIDYFKPNK